MEGIVLIFAWRYYRKPRHESPKLWQTLFPPICEPGTSSK